MTRWLAPVLGVLGLLTLLVGFTWAEWSDRMTGVRMVLWGVVVLVVAGSVAGLHMYVESWRRSARR